MGRWLSMRDYWTFKPKDVLENKRHLFECKDSESESGHSLLVRVAATHSGTVNGNRRFYRPDFMQRDTHNWTSGPYAKPNLIQHDEEGEIVGRVRDAKYIDESWKWAKDFPSVKDTLFYQTDARKRMSLHKSTDFIVKNLMPKKDYSGMGYIDLGIQVTNPDAIRKVLAEEYLTVSVGFKTDQAICSICHLDWAVDERCDHKPGDVEDGNPFFLISGAFNWQEVSWVNFPADKWATTISKKTLMDSLSKTFFAGFSVAEQDTAVAEGLTMTDELLSDIDFDFEDDMDPIVLNPEQLDQMAQDLESAELTADRAHQIKDELSQWKPEIEDEKTRKRSLTAKVAAKIRAKGLVKTNPEAVVDAETAKEIDAVVNPTPAAEVTDQATETPAADAAATAVSDAAKETVTLSERVTRVLSALRTELTEKLKKDSPEGPYDTYDEDLADGGPIAKLITDLDGAYDAFPDGQKYEVRCAVRAMLDDWCADGDLKTWLQILANKTDSVVLSKTELSEKDEAIAGFDADKDELTRTVTAEQGKSKILLADSKKSLASQIVMFKVLKGAEGFKQLDAAAIQVKVDELTKRNIVSLKDSVADIMSELKWEPSTEANPASAAQAESTVADTVQVDESEVNTLTPADKVQRDTQEITRLLSQLPAQEREIFLARKRFKSQK